MNTKLISRRATSSHNASRLPVAPRSQDSRPRRGRRALVPPSETRIEDTGNLSRVLWTSRTGFKRRRWPQGLAKWLQELRPRKAGKNENVKSNKTKQDYPASTETLNLIKRIHKPSYRRTAATQAKRTSPIKGRPLKQNQNSPPPPLSRHGPQLTRNRRTRSLPSPPRPPT